MPQPVPIATGQHVEPEQDPEDQVPHSFVEQVPKLQPINEAMRATLGFGIGALTGV